MSSIVALVWASMPSGGWPSGRGRVAPDNKRIADPNREGKGQPRPLRSARSEMLNRRAGGASGGGLVINQDAGCKSKRDLHESPFYPGSAHDLIVPTPQMSEARI